ncbi:putative CAAX amino terminal protease family [Methylacidimicrobium sp. AP8]|uniref:CPBP family intramembrane glutamic endopeptidase n=1 Tax=Methylacidimicrobium sp. AP8 TaxID=2730359 RepID=UPI0018C0D6F1|nr:CPBP family intramembrane glutamic endopeptidase [Methylacidimicrobium sp. AP8]CAB4242866.1 putative CAAX amino terminal protease family [Methylacidimicrobium sp. AP8]
MPPRERSVSALPAFLAYLVTIFLAAALLTPAAYALLSPVYPAHPGRYFRRLLEFSALLLLFPFRKPMGIRSWSDIGFARPVLGPFLRGWLLGLASGLACLLPLLLPALSGHPPTLHWSPDAFGIWTGRGLLIGLTEEILFRGIFFSVLLRGLGRLPAILASSLLFCLAHYLRSSPPAPESPPTLLSGWELLRAHLAPILSLSWADAHGLLLFSVGAALATAYLVTGTLWMPAGIHAAWVALLYGLAARSEGPPGGWWAPSILATFGLLLWIGYGQRQPGRAA